MAALLLSTLLHPFQVAGRPLTDRSYNYRALSGPRKDEELAQARGEIEIGIEVEIGVKVDIRL